MHKILIKIYLILFIFSVNAIAEQVNKVEIDGNQRISDETILVLGNIRLNEEFNNDKINESLKSLYETNFFGDINITFKNGILKINLKENPIIEDIEITGIKSKEFLKKLSDEMNLKNRMSFTKRQLDKDITLIKNMFLCFFLITIKL